jgi:hypothetical protein
MTEAVTAETAKAADGSTPAYRRKEAPDLARRRHVDLDGRHHRLARCSSSFLNSAATYAACNILHESSDGNPSRFKLPTRAPRLPDLALRVERSATFATSRAAAGSRAGAQQPDTTAITRGVSATRNGAAVRFRDVRS